MTNCSHCEELLCGEEREFPSRADDEVVCDTCYSEWFYENSFDCPLCCEPQLDDDQTDYFVLFDASFGAPGIYKALSYPFYSQGSIGAASLWPHAVSRVGFVPPDAFCEDAPCAFICASCITERYKGKVAAVCEGDNA